MCPSRLPPQGASVTLSMPIFLFNLCYISLKLLFASQKVVQFVGFWMFISTLLVFHPSFRRQVPCLFIISTHLLPGCLAVNYCSVCICSLNELPVVELLSTFHNEGNLEVASFWEVANLHWNPGAPDLFVTLSHPKCLHRFSKTSSGERLKH